MKYFNRMNYAILLLFFTLISCSSNKNPTVKQSKILQGDIIQETINAHFNNTDSLYIIPNNEQTKILYLSEKMETSVNPVNNITFFVYDKKTNEIIYQNKYSNAKLKWLNNKQLLLTQYFGIIETPDDDNIKNFSIDLDSKEITEIKKENSNY